MRETRCGSERFGASVGVSEELRCGHVQPGEDLSQRTHAQIAPAELDARQVAFIQIRHEGELTQGYAPLFPEGANSHAYFSSRDPHEDQTIDKHAMGVRL